MTCRSAAPQGSCHLARKLEALKENSPGDQKLQKLKERICEQRRQCRFRALGEKRPTRGYVGDPLSTPPLKRKVCKSASVSASLRQGGALKQRSQRGNATPKKRTTEDTGVHKTGANLFSASAWREGLRLARKILGPPLKYPKNGSEGEATQLATGSKTAWLAMIRGGQSLQGNCQDVQSETEGTKRGRELAELSQLRGDQDKNGKYLRLQKDPELGKREDQRRPTRRKGNAVPKSISDGVKGRLSLAVKSALAGALLEDSTGSSTDCKGRTTRSPQRSDHSGKENQPRSCGRPEMCRRSPYSPEQVHEFMKRKVAERIKRRQEEIHSSRQAHEARSRRLQEVYRKQKEAFGRKKGRTESQRSQRGVSERHQGLKCADNKHPEPEVAEWVHHASCALLRNEMKLHSDWYLTRNKTAEVTRRPGLPLSLAPEGGIASPLNLRDLSIPSSPTAQYEHGPFLPPKRSPEAPVSSDTPGLSPYRNKHDRVRTIHILARDLSKRLEREMERLQVTKGPADSGDQGRPAGTPEPLERFSQISAPAVPQREFGVASNPGAILDLSRLQRPSPRGGEKQERTHLEEGSTTRAATERTQPLSSIGRTSDEVWRLGSPPEGTAGWLNKTWRKETQEGGTANMEGFRRERGLLPGEPRDQAVNPSPPPQFRSGRAPLSPSTSPETEGYSGPHQKTGMVEGGSGKHRGLQPEQGCSALPQRWRQASGPSSAPSGNLARCKTAAAGDLVDSKEASDSTSQWSEMSQFYGGSSTFCRFGLTMVEQYLREEELRARHQSALLRLRDKALQEKAKAELAWLEHEKCCQDGLRDAAGAAAAAEKQFALLTKLKQEQAEIQHLRNIGRAAHQERKLLLKQRKDVLLVQRATAQLWQRLRKRAGTLPQRDAGNPAGFEGAVVLGQQRGEETSGEASFGATSSGKSGDGSGHSPQQCRNNILCAESGEILSQGRMPAEEFPKRLGDEDAKSLEMAANESLSSRERPLGRALKAGDYLVSKEEKEHSEETSLIKSSKEDHPHRLLDKGPEPLSSALSFTKSYSFSPDLENAQLNPEFQKAHAILIDISGSSLSASDLEADDAEATDISLPEEFVFQEETHDNPAGAVFCDTPAEPQRARSVGNASPPSGERRHIQASCGHSNRENSSFMRNQDKTREGTPGGDGIYEPDSVMLSNNGTPRLNASWTGGSLSFKGHAATARGKATSLKSDGANVMDSQGTPASEAALSSSSMVSQCPEDWRWPGTVPAISIAEADGDCETTSDFKDKCKAMSLPCDVSLKNINNPFQGSAFGMSGDVPSFPRMALSSSEDLLVPDSRACSAERLADEQGSGRPGEAAAQIAKEPTGYEESVVGLLCPKATEGIAQENQNRSPTNSQSPKEYEMLMLTSSSPQTGKLFQAQSCVMRCEDGTVLPKNEHLPEMEDDISSPVDEVLSYGSTDLPSSTEKDASFQYEDLPAPPEDVNGKSEDDSNLSLQDFPSPPEPLVFPETEELPYSMDEDASLEISGLPSLSDHLQLEGLPSPPSELTGVPSTPKLPLGQ